MSNEENVTQEEVTDQDYDPNDLDPTVEDPNPEPVTDPDDINYVAPAEGIKSRKER